MDYREFRVDFNKRITIMAKEMLDIGLNESGVGEDLVIANGDFVTQESTAMHQRELILNNKGDYKQNPTICVGAFNYLDDENKSDLARAISIAFTKDGMDVKSVRLQANGTVNSDAFYK